MSEPNNNGGAIDALHGRTEAYWATDVITAEQGPPLARTVFKFMLDVRDPQLTMPRGAQVLHIAQCPQEAPGAGLLSVWAEVEVAMHPLGHPHIDSTVVMEQVPVVVFGTGHPMPAQPLAHMGSAIDGPFVWHVFRVLPQ